MAILEFYVGMSSQTPLAMAITDAVPRAGEFISIRRTTWKVLRVTWAVDQPTRLPAQMRANVDLVPPDTATFDQTKLEAARYRWLRDGNGYVPEECFVKGGEEMDKLCDEMIMLEIIRKVYNGSYA